MGSVEMKYYFRVETINKNACDVATKSDIARQIANTYSVLEGIGCIRVCGICDSELRSTYCTTGYGTGRHVQSTGTVSRRVRYRMLWVERYRIPPTGTYRT